VLGLPAAVPWNLDALPSERLEVAYRELDRFVAWLRSAEVEVPECWHAHRWSVYRLAALLHWYADAHQPSHRPRESAEWWASSIGVEGLRRAWKEANLFSHGHFDDHGKLSAPPSLDESIRRHTLEKATRFPLAVTSRAAGNGQ